MANNLVRNGPTKSTYQQFDLWENFCYDTPSNTTYWLPDWYLNLGVKVTQPSASAATNPPQSSARDADDIVLTNVIGFDVKAWDPPVNSPPTPTASTNPAVYTGGYCDLGNGSNHFNIIGSRYSNVLPTGISQLTQVYDTFPVSYESDGVYQFNSKRAIADD